MGDLAPVPAAHGLADPGQRLGFGPQPSPLGLTSPADTPEPDPWALVRQDCLSGVSAPVVAERYGLSERSLRRRAAAEGWRRADRPVEAVLGETPIWNRGVMSREEAIADFPELGEVETATSIERFQLMFDPTQTHLRRSAFCQAAEAAALSRPAEALVWMRLVQSLERTGERIEIEGRPFRQQDYFRAAYHKRINQEFPEEPEPDEA